MNKLKKACKIGRLVFKLGGNSKGVPPGGIIVWKVQMTLHHSFGFMW